MLGRRVLLGKLTDVGNLLFIFILALSSWALPLAGPGARRCTSLRELLEVALLHTWRSISSRGMSGPHP